MVNPVLRVFQECEALLVIGSFRLFIFFEFLAETPETRDYLDRRDLQENPESLDLVGIVKVIFPNTRFLPKKTNFSLKHLFRTRKPFKKHRPILQKTLPECITCN